MLVTATKAAVFSKKSSPTALKEYKTHQKRVMPLHLSLNRSPEAMAQRVWSQGRWACSGQL